MRWPESCDNAAVPNRADGRTGEPPMGQTDNGSLPNEANVVALAERSDAAVRPGMLSLLPASLTWSATVDGHDGAAETEITDEMVGRAIAEMEREQPWPFRAGCDADAERVARPVRKADVIAFPGTRAGV